MSLIVLKPQRFADERGWFSESWNQERCRKVGISSDFCQDNHSYSQAAGTLRGIHFQRPPFAQAKLVRCVRGRIFDVAIDLRRQSPTFGLWSAVELSAGEGNQLFVPAGYGHAFVTLEDNCEILYKVDAPYSAIADGGVIWNDATIAVDWPAIVRRGVGPTLSVKDTSLPSLSSLDCDFFYDGQPMTMIEMTI